MNSTFFIKKAALALSFCAFAHVSHAQREYTIDAGVHQVVNNVYRTRANNFNKYFKCSVPFHEWQCDTLSRSDFDTLKKLLNTNTVLQQRPDSFFFAFHIFYGLDDTNIKLIYVPVFANYTSSDPETGVLQFSITPAVPGLSLDNLPDDSQIAYIRENGKLVMKPAADIVHFLTSYRESIRIDASGTGEWRDFSDRDDELGDAKAVLFPFQVVDALFTTTLDHENFDAIFMVNIAERDEINGLNVFKHSIAFSPILPGNPNPAPIAENLGTLCPPGCSSAGIQMSDHRPAPPYTYFGY